MRLNETFPVIMSSMDLVRVVDFYESACRNVQFRWSVWILKATDSAPCNISSDITTDRGHRRVQHNHFMTKYNIKDFYEQQSFIILDMQGYWRMTRNTGIKVNIL